MGKQHSRERLSTLTAVLGIVTLGLFAIGCGPTAPVANVTQTTPTLNIWQSDFRAESFESLANNLSTPNAPVKATKMDASTYEWRSVNQLAALIQPDVWVIPNDWLQDHKNKLVVIPNTYIKPNSDGSGDKDTTAFMANYYSFFTTDLMTTNGTLGFPGPVKPLKLFINTKLFAAANVRWEQALSSSVDTTRRDAIQKTLTNPIATWNDLVSASQYITQRNGNTVTVSGAALGMSKNIENAEDIMQLLTMQQGGKIVDTTKMQAMFQTYIQGADGQQRYPGMDALTFYTSFSNPNHPNYSWSADMGNARDEFLKGRVAMLFDYGDFEDTVRAQARDNVDLTVTDVPQLSANTEPIGFARYYIFGIPKATPQHARAAQVALSLTRSQVDAIVPSATEMVSPLKASATDANQTLRALLKTTPVFKKHHAKFDTLYQAMIDDVALRGKSVSDATRLAADQITTVLQQPDD